MISLASKTWHKICSRQGKNSGKVINRSSVPEGKNERHNLPEEGLMRKT
jgi:hypothetical protein